MTQFLAVQTKQLEFRKQELDIQRLSAETEKSKAENAHEYAMKALDAQVEDRKDIRKLESGNTRAGFWIVLVVTVGVLGLGGYALYANKDAFLIEVLKFLAFFFGGGGAGYALGWKKGTEQGREPPAPTVFSRL